MVVEQFWDIIEESRALAAGDPEAQPGHLQTLLEALPPDEILAFDHLFGGYAKLSYRAALWAAFYIKEGGCSDDWFDYYRYELIGAGQDLFETLIRDPDRLADDAYADFFGNEGMSYAAGRAYETVAATDLTGFLAAHKAFARPDMSGESRRLGLDPAYTLDGDPVMKLDFDDGDAMKALLPKTWARYGVA